MYGGPRTPFENPYSSHQAWGHSSGHGLSRRCHLARPYSVFSVSVCMAYVTLCESACLFSLLLIGIWPFQLWTVLLWAFCLLAYMLKFFRFVTRTDNADVQIYGFQPYQVALWRSWPGQQHMKALVVKLVLSDFYLWQCSGVKCYYSMNLYCSMNSDEVRFVVVLFRFYQPAMFLLNTHFQGCHLFSH